MKKAIYAGSAILLILAAVLFLRFSLPKADNETPGSELIKHIYSDEKLDKLTEKEEISKYCHEYIYNDLREISLHYNIDCIRDMTEYSEDYLPYVLFISDTGTKYFVFYYPDTLEVYDVKRIESFMSHDELEELILQAVDTGMTRLELDDIADRYDVSISSLSSKGFRAYQCAEGALTIWLYNCDPIALADEPAFVPNDELLAPDQYGLSDRCFVIYPILEIDKQ